MKHPRILAVHDISCIGRCSLTVAIPIISAAGIECSGIPTAILSTHTGGFTGFTYRDLTDDIKPIQRHWNTLGIEFDAFYTGFLGSCEQVDLVRELFDDLSHEGSTIYVDPVMADAGKLYSVFDDQFPSEMRKLCERADVIMPNLTELCMMIGQEWKDGPYTREYIDEMLEHGRDFGAKMIVLTGVSFEQGKVGAVYRDFVTGETGEVMRDKIPGYFHGTGDVFASALVGACESGLPMSKALEAAVDLTVDSIKDTVASGEDVRYGVNFERHLADYISRIHSGSDGISIRIATGSEDYRTIASLARTIWAETYSDILTDSQIVYMIERFQSYEAIVDQISGQGYTYLLIQDDLKPIGFCAYVPDDRGIFLSKIYIEEGNRGKGISKMVFDRLIDITRDLGKDIIHLTVNRNNDRAVSVYLHQGFMIVEEKDTPIGEGFFMNDYIMELRI